MRLIIAYTLIALLAAACITAAGVWWRRTAIDRRRRKGMGKSAGKSR
jgi:hypothetical protein